MLAHFPRVRALARAGTGVLVVTIACSSLSLVVTSFFGSLLAQEGFWKSKCAVEGIASKSVAAEPSWQVR